MRELIKHKANSGNETKRRVLILITIEHAFIKITLFQLN